jgi:hypothetical protein
MMDKVQNPVILSVIHHRQNPLNSTTIIVVTKKYKITYLICDLDVSFNENLTDVLKSPPPKEDRHVFQLQNMNLLLRVRNILDVCY